MTTTTTYPKEMHLFLLQNTGLIEKGSLTDAVEETIFAAIHERITRKLERRPWELHCNILKVIEGSYGETMLAPIAWPQRKDEKRLAYYRIWEAAEGNVRWLSCLLGLNKAPTCFELYIDGRLGGPKVNVKDRTQDFYIKTPAIHELGFTCNEGVLQMPFSFDAARLVEEYPDLRKTMLAFEGLLDKLLKAHEHIDKLIMSMVPVSGQNGTQK